MTLDRIRKAGRFIFFVNVFLLLAGGYYVYGELGKESLGPIIVMATFILGDCICRLSLRASIKRNDYRIFTGVSGREDKILLRARLERSIFINSVASFVGIGAILIPVIIKKYSTIHLFLSLGLFMIFLFTGLVLNKDKQGPNENEKN